MGGAWTTWAPLERVGRGATPCILRKSGALTLIDGIRTLGSIICDLTTGLANHTSASHINQETKTDMQAIEESITIVFTKGSYRNGSILRILLDWVKDNPEYLTRYVEDFFVKDYQRMKEAAVEGETTTYYILGLRNTGSRLFEVGEEPGEGNTMSGAVLSAEDRNPKHQWFLLEIPTESKHYHGAAVNGKVKPLDSHRQARSILQAYAD